MIRHTPRRSLPLLINERAKQLMRLSGVGPTTATAILAINGPPRHGRQPDSTSRYCSKARCRLSSAACIKEQ
jgi:transposase